MFSPDLLDKFPLTQQFRRRIGLALIVVVFGKVKPHIILSAALDEYRETLITGYRLVLTGVSVSSISSESDYKPYW